MIKRDINAQRAARGDAIRAVPQRCCARASQPGLEATLATTPRSFLVHMTQDNTLGEPKPGKARIRPGRPVPAALVTFAASCATACLNIW